METKKSRLTRGGIVLLFCGIFALTGFSLMPAPRAMAATTAFVRIIHASPFVATADVFVDGNPTPFLHSFPFGDVTPYAALPPGPHKVQIALVGKGIGASALTETLDVQPGGVYTVAAIGTSAQNLTLKVFVDSNLATAGKSEVRIYQLSPNSGSMNVLANGTSIWDGAYQEYSDYVPLSPGSTTFDLDSSAAGKSLSLSTTLKANTVTSIFAVGMFNGAPKAEVVSSVTAALPGLPQTGSDPFATISSGQSSIPWLLIAIALVAVSGTFFTRRLFASH